MGHAGQGTETNLTKYVLRSDVFSFINNSSMCSGRVSSSLLESSIALILSEGMERGRCSRVKRFGGVLNERIYIMYRVCTARIAVTNGQYFG